MRDQIVFRECQLQVLYKSFEAMLIVKDIGATDLHADGPLYTWSNNRRVGYVGKKVS